MSTGLRSSFHYSTIPPYSVSRALGHPKVFLSSHCELLPCPSFHSTSPFVAIFLSLLYLSWIMRALCEQYLEGHTQLDGFPYYMVSTTYHRVTQTSASYLIALLLSLPACPKYMLLSLMMQAQSITTNNFDPRRSGTKYTYDQPCVQTKCMLWTICSLHWNITTFSLGPGNPYPCRVNLVFFVSSMGVFRIGLCLTYLVCSSYQG